MNSRLRLDMHFCGLVRWVLTGQCPREHSLVYIAWEVTYIILFFLSQSTDLPWDATDVWTVLSYTIFSSKELLE